MGRKEDDRIRRLAKKRGWKASKSRDGFSNPVWIITDDNGEKLETKDDEGKLTTLFFEEDAIQKLEED
jgi:hypothetical protein